MAPDRTASDAELFAQLAGGREAAESLFRRYAAMAYGLALDAIGDPSAAEDVVQEAFLNLLRRPPGAASGSVRSYVASVVLNAARSRFRSEKRRQVREERVALERPARGASLDEAAETREASRALRVALAGLPGEVRTPVLLHVVHEFSQREIARTLSLPHSTVSKRIKLGLARVRAALRRAGFASMADMGLLAELAGAGAVEVPSSLAASLTSLAAKAVAGKAGAAGAAGTTVLKGGVAMKAIAGVLVAGALAGAVAVSTGMTGGTSPAVGDGKPAPVNPYKGMKEREEVYEFTAKPAVKKEGDKWVITFASKGKCDATVAILGKDSKIVRHLASGVLGPNAPHPFQQNSLSQKIEWDGLADDFKKAPAGCKVRVSLGLKAEFERNIAYDPYDLPDGARGITQQLTDEGKYLAATDSEGKLYVLALGSFIAFQGRVYDKDGKYVRTFWPPAAADLEKVTKIGIKLATTKWGDKTPVTRGKITCFASQGNMRKKPVAAAGKAMFDFVGIVGFKEGPRPEVLPASKLSKVSMRIFAKVPRATVNRADEELYAGSLGGICRFDGKTGEMDPTWKTKGKWGRPDTFGKKYGDTVVGPDGLLYIRVGAHERYLMRTDRDGKIIPFKENVFPLKNVHNFDGKRFSDRYGGPHWDIKPGCLITGSMGSGNTYMNGIDVTEDGTILLDLHSWQVKDLSDPKAMRVALADTNKARKAAADLGVDFLPEDDPKGRKRYGGYMLSVWKNDGTLVTRDAVEGKGIGDGAYMDRDGNIYLVQGGAWPEGQKTLDGITDVESGGRGRSPWGGAGSLIKFRGRGGTYPVGKFYGKMGYYGGSAKPAPADAMKMTFGGGNDPIAVSGAEWAYGVTNQSSNDCNCPHARFYLDPWARSWLPANALCSVVVLDSNGNRVVRLGKYGNVDDTEADVKAKRDGLRFIWVRAVTTSDTALYAMDYGNRRILKAALSYAAEEELPLP